MKNTLKKYCNVLCIPIFSIGLGLMEFYKDTNNSIVSIGFILILISLIFGYIGWSYKPKNDEL